MNVNRLIVPVGILMAAVLIIAGGYTLLKDTGGDETQYEGVGNETSNETYVDEGNRMVIIEHGKEGDNIIIIEQTEKDAKPFEMPEWKSNSTSVELQLNAKVPFTVGEKYTYKETNQQQGLIIVADDIYSVEKIERVNGEYCYVVVNKKVNNLFDSVSGEKVQTYEQITTYYYAKDTGNVIKIVTDMGMILTGMPAEMSAKGSMFSPWMLALTKDFKWSQAISLESNTGMKNNVKYDYEVMEIEKVNGRECFKVDAKTIRDIRCSDIFPMNVTFFT
jgi:hypothetical protein